jgi:hypothetical protein
MAAWILVAGNGMAETFPKVVRGFVWDSEGRTVEAADVTINIKDGGSTIATYTETTTSIGFYSLTVASEDWDVGNTIELIASFGGNQDSNSTIATSAPIQYVNMTFTFEIPEFGSMAGFIVTGGLLGAVAVVALVYFRKR